MSTTELGSPGGRSRRRSAGDSISCPSSLEPPDLGEQRDLPRYAFEEAEEVADDAQGGLVDTYALRHLSY
jgi:hypothetical protein